MKTVAIVVFSGVLLMSFAVVFGTYTKNVTLCNTLIPTIITVHDNHIVSFEPQEIDVENTFNMTVGVFGLPAGVSTEMPTGKVKGYYISCLFEPRHSYLVQECKGIDYSITNQIVFFDYPYYLWLTNLYICTAIQLLLGLMLVFMVIITNPSDKKTGGFESLKIAPEVAPPAYIWR